MLPITRRSLLATAAALPAARAQSHPLEGIRRENLKITDVTVTLMSYELKDKAWVTGTQLIWKSDSVLVRIFTDKGIVGIGEASPYGNPEYIKKTIDELIKPTLIGKNPFDVEFLCTRLGRRVARPVRPVGRRGRGVLGHHRKGPPTSRCTSCSPPAERPSRISACTRRAAWSMPGTSAPTT